MMARRARGAAQPAQPPLPGEVRILVAVAFFVALGFGIVAPALPVFARDFGVGKASAAAVISAFAFMRIIFALPAGRLVDRFGERLILAAGIAIVASSSALAGLANSYVQLITLRGIGGVGSAMFSISSMSLLVRLVPSSQRGQALGYWQGGFLLGAIAGPVVGGFVDSISIRLPFFLYAGTLSVAGTVAVIALRATPLAEVDVKSTSRTSLPDALRNPAYRAALAANFADGWGAVGVRSALIPLFVSDVLHKTPIWTGLGFLAVTAVNGATLIPAGRYADRVGRRPLLIAGCLGSGVGIALLPIWSGLAGYLIGMGLLGLGSGLLDVAPGAVVGDVVDGRGGPVFAAYTMSSDLGVVVGPVAAGVIADVSYTDALGSTAAIFGVAAIFALVAPETLKRGSPGGGAQEPPVDTVTASPRLDGGTSVAPTT
jgi:MFS transporter, DHA1 family, multidrug resistance protein